MRYLRSVVCAVLACAVSRYAQAAPFQDLDFEQATTEGATGNTVSAHAAFPEWTITIAPPGPTSIFYDIIPLDETAVALLDKGAIQGNYMAYMSDVGFSAQDYVHTAEISQTGDVPAGAKSILFSFRPQQVFDGISPPPVVFLNGGVIQTFPVSTASGVTLMAGDISALAGTNAVLTFAAAGGVENGPFPPPYVFPIVYESSFFLDAISFSPLSLTQLGVPEPLSLAPLAAGLPLLLPRPRRRT